MKDLSANPQHSTQKSSQYNTPPKTTTSATNNLDHDDDFDTSISGFNDDYNDDNTTTTVSTSSTSTSMKRKNEDGDIFQPLKKQTTYVDLDDTTNDDNNNGGDANQSFSFGLDDADDQVDPPPVDIDDMLAQRQALLDDDDDFVATTKKPTSTTTTYTATWSWKNDNGDYVIYKPDVCKRIEDAYAAQPKGNFKVDSERLIDFGKMIQRRIDNPNKIRQVKRELSKATTSGAPASKPSTSTFGSKPTTTTSNVSAIKKPTNSVPTTFTPPQNKPSNNGGGGSNSSSTSTSSTSSSARPTAPDPMAFWSWKGDLGWNIYEEGLSVKIEEAFVNNKKRVQIDDDRYIDLEYNAQKRYDDINKMRPIKREIRGQQSSSSSSSSSSSNQQATTTTKPSTPKQPTQSSSSSSSSNKSNAPPPAKTGSTITSFFSKTNQSSSSGTTPKKDNNVSTDKSDKIGKGRGQWKWLSDNGWVEYSGEVSEVIEGGFFANVADLVITVAPGEKRLIDYKSMLQRRLDDPELKRSIKRYVDLNPMSLANKPKDSPKKKPTYPVYNDDDFIDAPSSPYDSNTDDIDLDDPYFLQRKRALYKCGDEYVELDNIQSWFELIEEKRAKFKIQSQTIFPPNGKLNQKISLYGGDITTLEIDAIVNAARTSLLGGGGIDGAIHRAAGPGLLRECESLNGCKVGQSKITKGYRLPAKYIIHTVGPMDANSDALKSCYKTTMGLMLENQIRTVALCCVATGVYGFPAEEAAHISIRYVREWLQLNHNKVDRIIFCVFTTEDYKIYGKLLQTYFPVHPEA
ncbi:hypothetical protein SAMD00019534_005130 [Acytostelium subglobosum LB1]|uniref:hypothetical protein n=1 Tax=Acytostelium subglobosum LB1 TaxID=1410327 RepID=UPI00064523A7|nr:hypothetical protein SAMD00019534_005130 [Acytostelium subglobosum LB1]GAM17338.1 hypothetical protein SAMD00019534_005130 [Acytostelium subglobosum LB1]|eukprot:XP_012759400.1 hypothetical protein SAMD00019534_005130 [Acytostelium subglobosum LB1]